MAPLYSFDLPKVCRIRSSVCNDSSLAEMQDERGRMLEHLHVGPQQPDQISPCICIRRNGYEESPY